MEQKWISIDYEGRSHITCLGVGWTPTEAMCIPLSRVGSSTYWTRQEEIRIWQLWCALLENPNVKKIAQNASYEWIKSWLYGIYPAPLGIDTMHAHHCLYPDFGGINDEWSGKKRDIDNPGHGLALITSQYTDQPFYKDDGRHWTPELGEERFWRYNALDVMVTFECAMKMKAELEDVGLWDTYDWNYRQTFENALRMEWNGIAIDVERREAARSASLTRIEHIAEVLRPVVGMHVVAKAVTKGKPKPGILNLASPKQMLAYLQSKKYKIRINRKTGKPTVDKDTLQMLAIQHDAPELKLMLDMKREQDFINDEIDLELDVNNRIHSHNKLGGTNGTRWSGAKSILGTGRNLQNLPRTGPARSFYLPN